MPFLQSAFSTVGLSASDWLRCVAVASSVLWLREASKIVTRIWTKQAGAADKERDSKVLSTPIPSG